MPPHHRTSASERVILVDRHDRDIGTAEKLEAHRKGWLHRAFSVFVFNSEGQLLLQQRHPAKYHSGGLWSNTCCSHPRPGEPVDAAAHRRLREEMGIACALERISHFVYKTALDDDLYEHEVDHVLVGTFDGDPTPSRYEVSDWRWADVAALRRELDAHPDRFTHWFPLALREVIAHAST